MPAFRSLWVQFLFLFSISTLVLVTTSILLKSRVGGDVIQARTLSEFGPTAAGAEAASLLAASMYPAGSTADIGLSVLAPSSVERGKTFTVNLTVTNNGPSVSTNVLVTSTVPEGWLFQKASSEPFCQLQGNMVTCPLPSPLTDNRPQVVRVAYSTPRHDACTPLSTFYEAMVRSDQADSVSGNDRATATVTIACPQSIVCPDGTIDRTGAGCFPLSGEQSSERNFTLSRRLRHEREAANLRSSSSSSRPTEPAAEELPACSDGIDNDRDRLTDFPEDPGCRSPLGKREGGGSVSRGERMTVAVVEVEVGADRGEVQPGGTMLYTITLQNTSGTDAIDLTVEQNFSGGDIQVLDAGEGSAEGSVIRWTLPRLPAGDIRVLRARVKVGTSTAQGNSIASLVVVSGSFGSTSATSVLPIIGRLPQTGVGDFTRALEDTRRYLHPAGASASLATVLLTLFLPGAVIAGGIVAARRRE